MIPEEIIEEIKNRVNIAEVVGEYVHLTQKGDRFWGLSPFKSEKTPSFTVTPSKQMYYCFSTQNGGNVFKFLMEMEGMTFPEAVEYLGKRVGIDVGEGAKQDTREFRERAAMEELYEKIRESYQYLLTEKSIGKNALQYITHRGLSSESFENFALGYSHPDPYWLHGFLIKKGYSEEFLQKSGLFSKKNPKWTLFSNRLMFPISRHQGSTVAFGGRLLEGDGPKYINSPDTMIFHKRTTLYGLHQAKDAIKQTGFFIVCEGYLDVIAFHQAGVRNAVAPLGTAFTADQAKLLKRYASKGLLVFDGDSAGINASKKTAQILESLDLACDVLSLPEGLDPADILQKKGSQELKNLVKSSTTALEFLLSKAVSMSDIYSPEGKQQILEQLFPYIRSIQSPVKQEASLQILSERIGVSLPALMASMQRNGRNRDFPSPASSGMINGRGDKGNAVAPGAKPAEGSRPFTIDPELHSIVATAIYPEHFAYVRSQLQFQDLKNEAAAEIYSVLEDHFRNQTVEFDKIISDIDNEGLRNYIMRKASAEEYGADPGGYIRASILRVRHDLLVRRRRELQLLLKRKEQSSDAAGTRALLEEKIYLDSALKEIKESIHDRTAE